MNDTYAEIVRQTAAQVIAEEAKARADFAAELAGEFEVRTSSFETVLEAAGRAKPWRKVLRIAETRTLAEALTSVREGALEALVEFSETQSTSPLRNEQERTEREGLRRFLRRSARAVERLEREAAAEEAPAEAPAAVEETPAKATGRKPSTAQRAVLERIRTGGVVLHNRLSGQTATGPTGGEKVRVVQACVRHGWAVATGTVMDGVRPLELTDQGRAVLAG